MPVIVQILIAVIPTVGAITVAIFNIRAGNKIIDLVKDNTSDTKEKIIGDVIPGLNSAEKKRLELASDIRMIVDDVKARNAISSATGGTITRNEMIANLDRIYEQNNKLTDQVKDLQRELESARDEIERLRSITHDEDHII